MDKQERLKVVFAGEKVDRIPCGFWHHFPEEAYFGEKSIRIHQSFYEETDVDVTKVMNEYTYRFDRKINNIQDWEKIKPIRIADSHYTAYLDEIRAIRKALGPKVPILATIHGLLVSACHATDGSGVFSNLNNLITRHLKEDPETVSKGLHAISQTLGELCECCVDAGADGIYYAALGGEAHRFDQEMFETYVKPLEISILQRAKAKGLTFLHVCKENVRLPMYVGYPADVINWAIHDCPYGLGDGRKLFPGITLLGGFDDRSGALIEGTMEDIQLEAQNILKEAGRERLIIGTDCTLPRDISMKRIHDAVSSIRNIY